MKGRLLSAAVAAVLAFPGVANATLEKFDFSTTYNGGPFNGDALTGFMLLDLTASGLATSGTLDILTGPGLPTPQVMGLAPPSPPSSAYEAGDGTELSGNDNMIPITGGGITFGTNAPDSLHGGYTLQFLLGGEFGECASNVVCGFIAGPGGDSNLYNALGPTTLTEGAVPEPSTWAMMGLGFAALGLVSYRARRSAMSIA
jgi:PEP-CTERM motif